MTFLDLVFHALGGATRRQMLQALEGAALIRREVRGRTHACRLEPDPLADAQAFISHSHGQTTQEPTMTARTTAAALNANGQIETQATLRKQRLLPGPIGRVWCDRTDSDLRRQWLASGLMPSSAGQPFELVWRTDELTTPPGRKPDGFGTRHSMAIALIEISPSHWLVFTWQGTSTVCIELQIQGEQVRLSLTHEREVNRPMMNMVGAGWHMHLDLLAAKVSGQASEPFWDGWSRLRAEYDQRLTPS